MKNKIFDDLFILDMANNHQGDIEHGKLIISEVAKLKKELDVKIAIKFQYRDLGSLIHPAAWNNKELKHIPRFIQNRLSFEQYFEMVDYAKKLGLITIATPFDESSVDYIIKHNIDILKIASCSSNDWPLLEKAVTAQKPIIISTGGLNKSEIDNVVSLMTHKKADFALMHCVGIYPCEDKDLHLNRINYLIERYPHLTIGFSTHEVPTNYAPVQMAIAKGAKILERHIDVPVEKYKMNAYSSTPEQVKSWINSALLAVTTCDWDKDKSNPIELESMNSLKRGVYAKINIKKGEKLSSENVYYAMPLNKGQMQTTQFKEFLLDVKGNYRSSMLADKDYQRDEPIGEIKNVDHNDMIFHKVHNMKALLYQAKIALEEGLPTTLSHQYGIEKFDKIGAMVIDVVNRNYCKKLIIQTPHQVHPSHYHKIKEETFIVLYGDMILTYGSETMTLTAGQMITIKVGIPHSFTTNNGVVIEEVSTHHEKADSFYTDPNIEPDADKRKTKFNLW